LSNPECACFIKSIIEGPWQGWLVQEKNLFSR